jgi:hypothetical protein
VTSPTDPPSPRGGSAPSRPFPHAFTTLKWTSFCHSCIYLSLLLCAFALHKPEPATFTLGLTHGILWIVMSLACITAARVKIVSLRLSVAVAVLGGIGPFFGSFEFLREQRRRAPLPYSSRPISPLLEQCEAGLSTPARSRPPRSEPLE